MISVIIPTYNDWKSLEECLSCVINQKGIKEQYEVIVVNNNPGGEVPGWINIIGDINLIDEYSMGSYAARNAGVLESSGDILCFTDSDCIPDSLWLYHIIKDMYENKSQIVAGAVEVIPRDKNSISALEAYDIAVGIRQDLYVKKGSAATANLCVRKSVFESLGGFDSSRLSGGDTDFCRRALRSGFGIVYCEDAIVRHPARNNWSVIINKSKRVYGGRAKTSGKEYIKRLSTAFAPPFVRFLIILRSDLSFINKIKAIGVLFVIKFVQSLEFIRVSLGKTPVR